VDRVKVSLTLTERRYSVAQMNGKVLWSYGFFG
jgi:hypothetical protein